MNSHEIVQGFQYKGMEAAHVDTDPKESGVAGVTTCECGLPELCCEHYCDIDISDWLIY